MFTEEFKPFACEGDTIACTVDGLEVTATLHRDDCNDTPDERQDGFWPSKNEKDAGYVLPHSFDEQQALAEKVMTAWKRDEWFYCGVALTVSKAGVQLTPRFANALWGVECNYPNSDNSYLQTVATELLGEALDQARAKLRELCTA